MKQNLLSFVFLLVSFASLRAQTVWNGPTITFTKAPFANPALAANQDRLTANTWLTRGDVEGIFNIAQEVAYVRHTSPANTEWATGSLANYATLTYRPWFQWAAANPPATVGVQAVLHLITENIYVGIRFTSWGVGGAAGGGFSYVRTTANVPAPVKLAGFTAAKRANAVQLSWTTASEENTASFSVERSADGLSFSAIGSVPAAGFSSDQKHYAFTDALPLAGNFYRLRINDKDGQTSYSGVLAFKTGRRPTLEIFPVPVKNVLNVQSNYPAQTTLQVADAAGRIVKAVCLAAGDQSFTLDVSGLKPGLYFLRAGAESKQLIKE